MVDAYMASLELTGLAEENLQARLRGTPLMAVDNQEGHLVLATGNKSELAVGYSTIYGDAVGGFGPIKDVPKTWVFRLARWRNAEAERRGEIAADPGELDRQAAVAPSCARASVDTDSLPEYDLLDDDPRRLRRRTTGRAAELVGRRVRPRRWSSGCSAMVDCAEYKRRQYPPGTKISRRAFGRDRRLPITNRWRETAD